MATTDYIYRTRTHDAVTSTNTGDPVGSEIIQPSARQANDAGTGLLTVKLHGGGDSATVQIQVYDSILGWAKSEKLTFPPPTFTAPGVWAMKTDIVGETLGITVPVLSGTISITAALVARKTGGS